jgi:hypothetical protein
MGEMSKRANSPKNYIALSLCACYIILMENFHVGQVVYHGSFGTGRVVNIDDLQGKIVVNFIKAGPKFFTQDSADEELGNAPPEGGEGEDDMEMDELKEAIRQVLLEEGLAGATPIGERWAGGEMLLKPGKPGTQEKSVPIETFFHKVVMLRNQLRVLEQNINSSESLTDAEKIDMQQYITRCYGSLTTFNVLFSEKKDWFVGAKKE